MMADRTFHRAIPGLMDALPDALRREAEAVAPKPFAESLAAWEEALRAWPFPRDRCGSRSLRPSPTIAARSSFGAARTAALEHGVGFHTTSPESKVQALAGVRLYGMTQTAYLDSLGVLGPHFTARACGVARPGRHAPHRGCGRSGCPQSGFERPPGERPRGRRGGAPRRRCPGRNRHRTRCTCSDNLNMFEAMRIASMVSRVQELDYERWLATGEVLDLATRGSAAVLGFGDEIGSIEPGRKADIVFLDLGQINYVPLNDPGNQIVHGEDGTGVESVMIGGRMVLEGRRMVTVDEAKLARRCRGCGRASRRRQCRCARPGRAPRGSGGPVRARVGRARITTSSAMPAVRSGRQSRTRWRTHLMLPPPPGCLVQREVSLKEGVGSKRQTSL